LLNHEPYHAPGGPDGDDRLKAELMQRMQHRIERLGYNVTLNPMSTGAV
jgi:hypothetical protein